MPDPALTSMDPDVPDDVRSTYNRDVTDRLHALIDGIETTMAADDTALINRQNLVRQETLLVLELLDEVDAETRASVLARLQRLGLYDAEG